MKQSSPARPIYRLRVFSACLLSLLILAAPMVPLAASAHLTTAAIAEKRAERKRANIANKGVSYREASQPLATAAVSPGPIKATLSDSIIDTSPADGRADAGSIVTYTATITNTGNSDLTGVTFTDTISPYTTLLGSSIKISPQAIGDLYNATQNTVLDTAGASLPTVLANDTGTPAPTVGGIVGCADVTAPYTCNTTQAGGTVTLNTNGSFTYTPPSAFTGTDTFTYKVTNGLAPDDTATVTITVGCGSLTVTNPATSTGTVDAVFSQTFTQTGGSGTTNFVLNSGSLPAGLTLATSGLLSGTSTVPGTFPITVKATDANGCIGVGPTYNLTIACQTITVTNPATTTGTVDAAFSQTFTQSGVGTHTPAVFTVNSGSLPAGLTLSSAGVLSGTPTAAGTFPITVKATDSNGCNGIGSTYNLVIACQTITVTNPATTTGTVDAAFSQTFTQSGVGTHTPAVFSINSGSLPSGLTLSAAGVLSGTPGQSGSFPITVKVTDANGCTGIGSSYTLVIGCQTITVTKPATTTGTVDAPFSQTFTQSGVGTHTPATFTTASTLPAGLTLSTGGVLSGTPTQSGSFPTVVTVTDANGCTGTSSTYSLVINCQTITVTKPVTTTGTVDAPFSQNFTQTGAHGTATFTTASTLPSGLSLATNGTLSGSPNVTGSFPIVVTVTDSNGCTGTSSTYTLVIGCQSITITNPATTTGTVDTSFSQQFTQSGGHGTTTFALNSGSLPSGLSFSIAGLLSGTPTQPGSFPITVKATDANSCVAVSSTYTLVIGCQTITVINPGVTTGIVDAAFSQTFTQSGAHGTATFTLNTGSLPSGLTLATNGTLSGTPGQPGSFPITVKVTDANGCTGVSSTYTLVIGCQTITVTNPATTAGTVDAVFSQTFTQSGVGTHAPANFTTASTLPSGLSLSSAGVLSGTPGQPGNFPIVVTVTDANGCTGTSATYTLVIACQTITVTNPGVTLATYNTAFSQTFTGTNLSHTPLNWSLASGSLPAGITLNSSTGVLSGTPTVTGTFAITVKVTDTNGCNGTGSTYTLKVQPKLVADSYTTEGNTQLFITGIAGAPVTPAVSSGTGLLANDSADVAISTSTGTAPTLGVISYDTAGRFIYTPNVGVTGSDVFTYSGTANGVTATATITITISNRVWYVNSSGGAGDGRSNTPFNSMTGADTAANAANDYIFVHTGGATTTGNISLLASQTLWGQGSTFTLGPLTIASGTKPTLTGTVTLGGNNDTVSSLDISSGSSTGITNSGAITVALVTNNVTVTTTTGTGVSFNGIAGTLTFTGLTSSAGTGANLTGSSSNSGATFNFSGVAINSGANPGFICTGGGTLNVTGANNTIGATTAGSGTGINISDTTIGASNVTFKSISVNGGSNGIFLKNTGVTGNFDVTGTVASTTNDGSGGTIQNLTGAETVPVENATLGVGIYLNNTKNPSFNHMNLHDFSNYAVAGTSVTGFNMTYSTVNGVNGTGPNRYGGFGEGAVIFQGLLGSATVDHCNFSGAASYAFLVLNNSSQTLNRATITFCSFAMTDTTGNDALTFQGTGGTMNMTVQDSTFTAARGDLFNLDMHGTISCDLVFGGAGHGNTLSNNNTNIVSGGGGITIQGGGANQVDTFTFNISNNTMRDAKGGALSIGAGTGAGTNHNYSGTINANTIGVVGVTDSGSLQGSDIFINFNDAGTATFNITNNILRQYGGGNGINLNFGTFGSSNPYVQAVVTGNTISNPGTMGSQGFLLTAGTGPALPETGRICLTLTGNSLTGSGSVPNGATDMRIRNRFDVKVGLPGYAGPQGAGNTVGAFIIANNSAGATASVPDASLGTTNGTTNGFKGTCPPLLLAMGGISSARDMFPLAQSFDFSGFSTVNVGTFAAAPSSVSNSLNQQQLDSIVSAAIQRWSATGLTAQQITALRGLKFEIADLQADYLGEAGTDRILVDRNAERKGWFVDPKPLSDTSFAQVASTTRLYTDPLSAPAGHVDLLTAIEHEMGHKLGLGDSYNEKDRNNLMYGYLTVGERRLPASGQAQNARPGSQGIQHLKLRSSDAAARSTATSAKRAGKSMTPLSGETVTVNINKIPVGKSVTITFQVQLNTAMPSGTSQVTTQGTVTYTVGPLPIANGDGVNPVLGPDATVLTDDPKFGTNVAGEADPTVTPIDAPTAAGSTVSGQILDGNGNPVEGAAVRMTGTQNRLTVTDANGNYHFDEVETNGFYTVVPSRSNFTMSPSQRAFSQLGQHTDAVFVASSTGTSFNPLDTTEYFVRQQYVDFLGREPDESGLGFWVNNIEGCGNDAQCRATKRTDTSAAFFLSIEFQQTGYLVYRTYQTAFGDMAGAPVPIKLGEFKPDTAAVAKDLIVNAPGWETTLENNKLAFMAAFVTRAKFVSAYPTSLSPTAFVDQLFAHADVTPADADRTAAINEFGAASDTASAAARGRALRRVAENTLLQQQEFTQAFVLMQYFGYLRRDPNAAPDNNYSGYTFWLQKLNGFNGNFGDAEMVKSFLVSTEYRGRFPR